MIENYDKQTLKGLLWSYKKAFQRLGKNKEEIGELQTAIQKKLLKKLRRMPIHENCYKIITKKEMVEIVFTDLTFIDLDIISQINELFTTDGTLMLNPDLRNSCKIIWNV